MATIEINPNELESLTEETKKKMGDFLAKTPRRFIRKKCDYTHQGDRLHFTKNLIKSERPDKTLFYVISNAPEHILGEGSFNRIREIIASIEVGADGKVEYQFEGGKALKVRNPNRSHQANKEACGPYCHKLAEEEFERINRFKHLQMEAPIGVKRGEHEKSYSVMKKMPGQPMRAALEHYSRQYPRPTTAAVLNKLLIPLIEAYYDQIYLTGLVHRDIQPENVLIDFSQDETIVNFIDVDNAMLVGDMDTTSGTAGYAPPELFTVNTRRVSVKRDIYSLGVLLVSCVNLLLDPWFYIDEYLLTQTEDLNSQVLKFFYKFIVKNKCFDPDSLLQHVAVEGGFYAYLNAMESKRDDVVMARQAIKDHLKKMTSFHPKDRPHILETIDLFKRLAIQLNSDESRLSVESDEKKREIPLESGSEKTDIPVNVPEKERDLLDDEIRNPLKKFGIFAQNPMLPSPAAIRNHPLPCYTRTLS